MRTPLLLFTICIEHHDKARNRNLGFTSAEYLPTVLDMAAQTKSPD